MANRTAFNCTDNCPEGMIKITENDGDEAESLCVSEAYYEQVNGIVQ